MKRSSIVFFSGLVAGLLVFLIVHFWRAVDREPAQDIPFPELAWIQSELSLSDAQFKAICELHEAYLPRCLEMCRRIHEAKLELNTLLETTDHVSSEIEAKLAEAAALRLECQKHMLQHFYQVSRVMPAEDGKRYLAKVQDETLRHP